VEDWQAAQTNLAQTTTGLNGTELREME